MTEETSNSTANGVEPGTGKPAAIRADQAQQAKARLAAERKGEGQNPLVEDATYGDLRQEDRVVMRHQIALKIDEFRAAPTDFQLRQERGYAPLAAVPSPFLSVVIPNFNGMRHLPTVMAALARQSFGDFEVIVVDDASTDASVAWLEAEYPTTRVVVNRRNEGFVASCNRGADVARGKVIVLLNSDTEPEPGWAAALASAVCEHPEASIFASKLLLYERRSVLHSAGDLLGADGVPRNRGVWEEDRGQYDAQTAVFGGCGGAVAIRRDLWRYLGGFDGDFWMYLEDADFALRARLAGARAIFVPEARVYHQLTATAGGALASYYVGRNTIWLIVKNFPRKLLIRGLPRIVASQARIAWDALRNWRGAEARARLRGQIAGLLGIGPMLRKRRNVQPRRQLDDDELAALLSS
jgi:GT2 family glycosyltransferase